MQKFFSVLLISMFFVSGGNAQDNNYAISLLSPALVKDANTVKRMEDTKVVISDGGKATVYHKYALTILNEAGDKNASFDCYYDKYHDIKYVEGKLFDASGNKIRSMKKSELKDYSAVEDNMMDDSRVQYYDFECKKYPYTVEYETELSCKNIFNLPDWEPVEHMNYSVAASSFTVQCPENYKLRYKAFNYTKNPDITQDKGSVIYKWSVENIAALQWQKYEPELYELTPTLMVAPSDFKMDDYAGNLNTWQALGKFIYSLNQGRDELPDNIKQTVHHLTDGVADVHQKIKILYDYLQKNTRYVSIQLGIGGWQTFDAKYVASKGYGDCKALSNYMHSLLKEAGIKGYYTLIKAGNDETDFQKEFPSNCFNHIIVCVPLAKDTMWLECTSNTLPAGYLGRFTCNRYALLIDEDGGKLVHTPVYNKEYNLQVSKINADLDSTGLLKLKANTEYTGEQQDILGEILTLPKDRLEDYQKERINLPSYTIDKSSYQTIKEKFPVINEQLEITANNYAAVTGRRIFINPDVLNRSGNQLKDYAERTSDIVIREEFKDIDSVEISIPGGYTAESIPSDVLIESKFGKYAATTKVFPDKIIYYRLNERNSGRYPATDAKALADFFDKISKADRAKVVLVKG